jgi:SARP family transcriptional regulator, regulator of embCAB operon
MSVRVFLTERVSIQGRTGTFDEQRLPGRQGRLVFAYLLARHGHPVSRDELAEALWGDELPATWEKALAVLVSKLRAVLDECGVDGSAALTSAFGCYQLTLPEGSWIDVSAAEESLEHGEAARDRGDLADARVSAETAIKLARRTFLPGENGSWVEEKRAELREILARGLECLADVQLGSAHPSEAVESAEELTSLEPYRESAYRTLMRAHVAAGNDAEALRVYERCRSLLADELGAYPSSDTEAVYLDVLRATGAEPARAAAALAPRHESTPPHLPRQRRWRRLVAGLAAAIFIAVAATLAGVLAWPSSSQRVLSTKHAGAAVPAHPRVALLLDRLPNAKYRSVWEIRSALDGLRLAANEYGLRTRIVAAGRTEADARRAAVRLGREGFDLVLVGTTLVDGIVPVVARYPRTRFVFPDRSLGDPDLQLGGQSNATGLVFADNQSGYLAGYLSGLMEARAGSRVNRQHVVSGIGGYPIPPVQRLLGGFTRGVKAALPGTVVRTSYAGIWEQQAPCAEIANRQIDAGSDIVFAAAGPCSLGALSVAGIRGVWGIGVDEDLSYLGTHILASTVKRLDRAVVRVTQWFTEGTLPRGRDVVLGLREYAVGIAGINLGVPRAVREKLARVEARLTKEPQLAAVAERPRATGTLRATSPQRFAPTGVFAMTVSAGDLAADDLPDPLQGRWHLTLARSGRYTISGNFVVHGVYRVSGHRLTIVEDAHGSCPGIPGIYRWRSDSRTLDLTTVKDTCYGGARSRHMTVHRWARQQ